MNDSLFNTIFTSIEVCAKNIDEYPKYERAEYHGTLVNERIKFHDLDADDTDWRVKHCYNLLISETIEREYSIENLWKRVIFNVRRSYPDFVQCVLITSFKSFCSKTAYAWVDKKFWYLDKLDQPWDILKSKDTT